MSADNETTVDGPYMVRPVSGRGAKIAAGRIGIPEHEYRDHIALGERWCGRCREWKLADNFSPNRHVAVGTNPYCYPCANRRARDCYASRRGMERTVAS